MANLSDRIGNVRCLLSVYKRSDLVRQVLDVSQTYLDIIVRYDKVNDERQKPVVSLDGVGFVRCLLSVYSTADEVKDVLTHCQSYLDTLIKENKVEEEIRIALAHREKYCKGAA